MWGIELLEWFPNPGCFVRRLVRATTIVNGEEAQSKVYTAEYIWLRLAPEAQGRPGVITVISDVRHSVLRAS